MLLGDRLTPAVGNEMANHKSAIKRNRQNEKRRAQNRQAKGAVRTSVRKVSASIESGNLEDARTLLLDAEKHLRQASSHGLYNKQAVSRKVSRLYSQLRKAEASAAA